MTDPDDGFEIKRLTYVGRRLTSKGQLRQAYAVDPWEPDVWLYSKAMRSPVVGGIYEVPVNEAGTARFSEAKFIESFADVTLLAEWRLIDQTATREKERRNAAARMVRDQRNIGDLNLYDIREAIRGQPQYVADGTILLVIRFLTGRSNT